MAKHGFPAEPWAERLARNSHQEGECRIWDGPTNNDGYGVFTYTDADGKRHSIGAHKAAFLAAGGKLEPRQVVSHIDCHRYLCIEPAHLVAASQLENMREREKTGTYRRRGGPWPTKGERAARLEAMHAGMRAREFSEIFGIGMNGAFQWLRRWRARAVNPVGKKSSDTTIIRGLSMTRNIQLCDKQIPPKGDNLDGEIILPPKAAGSDEVPAPAAQSCFAQPLISPGDNKALDASAESESAPAHPTGSYHDDEAEVLAGRIADTAERLNQMIARLRKSDPSARLRLATKGGDAHVESRFLQYPDSSGGFS